MYGKVRWFNKHFGYGFIRTPGGEDVFFHYTTIDGGNEVDKRLPSHYRPKKIQTLEPKDIVKYDAVRENGRLRAVKVERTALKSL